MTSHLSATNITLRMHLTDDARLNVKPIHDIENWKLN